MKYKNKYNGLVYYSSQSLTYKVNNKLFSGIPTLQQLLEWGFEEVQDESKEKTLADYKAEKLAELDTYDSSDTINSFTIGGKEIWLDAQTRQQLKVSLDAYTAMNINTVTKWYDGIKYTFPLSNWYSMLVAVEIYASECLNVTEQHRKNIESLETIEDVLNYDYTTDYPNKLNF